MSRKDRRKTLFVLILTGMGLALGLLVAAALIFTGHLQFGWTRTLQQRWAHTAAAAKPHRLLVLGDSFLTPWPVQHCLHHDLVSFCKLHNIGHINTAIGGYGPIEYWDNMQAAAPTFKPGLTILFHYAGNDLTDVLYRKSPQPRSPATNSLVVEPPHASAPARGGSDLVAMLPLATLGVTEPKSAERQFNWEEMARQGIHPDLIQKAKNRIANPNGISPDYVNPWLLELALFHKDNFLLDLLMEDPRCMDAWKTSTQYLKNIRDLALELDSDLWIVTIPATLQLDQSHFDCYRKATFLLDERLVGSSKPQELMREFCEEHDIRYLDLLPHFKAQPDTSILYWENDDHLSEAGHIVAMEAVQKEILNPWLQANQLPTPTPPSSAP